MDSFTWDSCHNCDSFAESVLALDEEHFINPGGKLNGMKDNETEQWKECQMSDLIAIWGDGTIQSELGGTYCTVTRIRCKREQMCQLLLLLLCTCLSSEYCCQFIFNIGYGPHPRLHI